MKIISIIPARGGSKGLPKKNILELAGKPLIAWTIESSLKSKYISKTKVKYSGNGIFVFSTISEKNNVGDCRIFDVKGKEIRPYVKK